MSYFEWFKSHGSKHKVIVDKLTALGYSQSRIIEYFNFDNMVKMETDFCPLYAQNTQCHEMEGLNCYFCACPLFRFNASGFDRGGGKTLFSYCSVNSRFGKPAEYGEAIHQDCTHCLVPHSKKYVARHFDIDWFAVMRHCNLEAGA